MIQTARLGGVHFVSFLVLAVNTAIVLAAVRRILLVPLITVIAVAGILVSSQIMIRRALPHAITPGSQNAVIAVQPNVPMNLSGDDSQMKTLLDRHFSLSKPSLDLLEEKPPFYSEPRLVILPE